jgi:hypothetical protein
MAPVDHVTSHVDSRCNACDAWHRSPDICGSSENVPQAASPIPSPRTVVFTAAADCNDRCGVKGSQCCGGHCEGGSKGSRSQTGRSSAHAWTHRDCDRSAPQIAHAVYLLLLLAGALLLNFLLGYRSRSMCMQHELSSHGLMTLPRCRRKCRSWVRDQSGDRKGGWPCGNGRPQPTEGRGVSIRLCVSSASGSILHGLTMHDPGRWLHYTCFAAHATLRSCTQLGLRRNSVISV